MPPGPSAEARPAACQHYTDRKTPPSRIPEKRGDQEPSVVLAATKSPPKTILLVCPTLWNEAELPRIAATSRYCVLSFGTVVSEHPERDGVVAFDDYPGTRGRLRR